MFSEDRKFWFSMGALAALVLCTLFLCCLFSAISEDRQIGAAIAKGVDPLSAYCAFNGGGERPNVTCVMRAQK